MSQSPGQVRVGDTPYYPMMNYRGLSCIPNPARLNGEDIDRTPIEFRRNINASGLQDVQINNGLQRGVGTGRRIPIINYLYAAIPRIPGQQRGDAGGFHKRGPSPYNIQNMFNDGPGSQPQNPGGPGMLAGNRLYNPMSG